uniref:J domain-containing protein n=2 Tax=Rhodosorus marinus TaxID=101924 RepID=A0A7S2ZXZ4_9RHOD|mmetsp:Transcript_37034/g.147782  ORF Transcript_37034/g.147782 Transcript_37034/m.147782 type:complete len:273 (+) Transcript_37034:231-1049(+)
MDGSAFVQSLVLGGKTGTRAACSRPILRSAADDSWASYMDEMRNTMSATRGVTFDEPQVESEEPTEPEPAQAAEEANFWTYTFHTPTQKETPEIKLENCRVNVTDNSHNGSGIKFDFDDIDDGTKVDWFADSREAYNDWESNGGYFKRTRYTFRDEKIYEEVEEEETPEWSTRIDYGKIGGFAQPQSPWGKTKKKKRRVTKKKIDLDLFQVLGLRAGAQNSDVKKAYRTLAKQYHPDLNQDNAKAAEKMTLITFAYNVLKDPATRKQYERAL